MAKFYKVGGCVRDKLMGRKCNDIDYSVEASSFDDMRQAIIDRGGTIFLETEKFLTIRAKVPKMGACDFVLCRKDGVYFDGRHPESVSIGNIFDDLSRRDLTINAIAELDGSLVDPFNGCEDIDRKIIRCVRNAADRFNEDALRILRVVRFAVVLGFDICENVQIALHNPALIHKLQAVSVERVREELFKMFKHDTKLSLRLLRQFPLVEDVVLDRGLWLEPTLRLQ
jgi:tRNA nucleotidyltransferase (CCA-adding enzyme)